mmetsp:Transcript_129176/g.227453  ORF Transcript_129176/g.227453 Transcript_129176/m.227453 type:complete len:408 (+) Transcript_129176:80-1303(+)
MAATACRALLRHTPRGTAPSCPVWRQNNTPALLYEMPQRAFGSTALSTQEYPAPRAGVPWHEFGFSLTTRETRMVIARCSAGRRWESCSSEPYGPLSLEPSATVLNYGQSIFEGSKAYRTERGRIVLFRPSKNAQRMANGARRLMMPAVPTDLYLEACSMAVRENADWVPPVGKGALYLRPLLFGSGADLGVKPSSEYTFVVYVAPVGKYFGPGSGGARMKLEMEHQRAAPAGIGHVKAAGNYAQCFAAQRDAKYDGFSDVIYLDVNGEYIEEAAASNFFCVDENKVIHTPQLGTILAGVTRDSVIQVVQRMRDKDIRIKVGKVSVETVLSSKEAFLTGTGAGITPIEHIGTEDESVDFSCPGPVTQMISDALSDIQLERTKDRFNWLHDPFYMPSVGYDSFREPTF